MALQVYPDYPQVRAVLPNWGDIGDIVSRGTQAGYGLGQVLKGVPQTEADLANQLTAGKLAMQPLERDALQAEITLAPLLAQAKYMAALTDANKPLVIPAGSAALRPGADSPFYQQPNRLTRSKLQFIGRDKQSGRPINFDPDTGEYVLGDLPAGGGEILPRTLPQPTVMEATIDGKPAIVSVQQGTNGASATPATVGTQPTATASSTPTGTTTLAPKLRPVAGETSNTIADFQTLFQDVAKLKAIPKDKLATYVGMIDFPAGGVQQRTGQGATPEQGEFRSTLQNIQNRLIYLLSGKQINEAEYERLRRAMPIGDTSEADFEARLANFESELARTVGNRIKLLQGSGYRIEIPDDVQKSLNAFSSSQVPQAGGVERWIRGPDGRIQKAQ